MMKNFVFLSLFLLLNGCLSSKESELINVNSKQLLDIIYQYKNKKVVLLNIWALWCKPCVDEFPMIASLNEEFSDIEIIFLNTDFEEQRNDVVDFLSDHKINKSYFKSEDDNSFINGISQNWNGTLPFTIIFSKDSSNIVNSWVGKKEKTHFINEIKKAL